MQLISIGIAFIANLGQIKIIHVISCFWKEVDCPVLTVDNSNVTNIRGVYLDEVTVVCNDGYLYENKTSVITTACLADSTWNLTSGTCESKDS